MESYKDCHNCPEIKSLKENGLRQYNSLSKELKETIHELRELFVDFAKTTAELQERLKAGNERFEKIEQTLQELTRRINDASVSVAEAHTRIDGMMKTIISGVLLVNGTLWLIITITSKFLR